MNFSTPLPSVLETVMVFVLLAIDNHPRITHVLPPVYTGYLGD